MLRTDNVISIVYLPLLIFYVSKYLGPTIFRTWFFSSDEWVFAAEVIRFSQLDFHQHFFDIPGTPFMILDAAVWSATYWCARAAGLAAATGLPAYTFEHLPALFILMRVTTLVCFILSAVLLFIMAGKLTNRTAGALASLFLVMSPIYTSYSSFVRTESMAMVLMLGAMLCVIRVVDQPKNESSRPPSIKDPLIGAGLLAGLAAGARLHSMTAILPVLVMMLWMNRSYREPSYPGWVPQWLKYLLPLACAASAGLFFLTRTSFPDLPAAVRLIGRAVITSVILSALAAMLYLISRTRWLVVRAISPDMIKLCLGYSVGFLLGIPTIWTQYKFFLASIQMYSSYMDFERAKWPFLKNLIWYVSHYLKILAPDRITLVLLCCGVASLLILRERKVLPVLAAALLFFVSKPLNLLAQDHHVILWLPFFYIVCAFPVGKSIEIISRRVRFPQAVSLAGATLSLYVCFQFLTPGPKNAGVDARANEDRLHNIERATEWIKNNAEPQATVAISYFCFNPDAFYAWLRYLEVPIPPSTLDGRQYVIWWGHGSALKGNTGYVCATRLDVDSIKKRLDLALPGEGTDPYSDRRFRAVASFGAGTNEVDLFRFDYR